MKTRETTNDSTLFLSILVFSLLTFVLFYPPLTWSTNPPASFWTKQVINLVLLSGAFYVNAVYVTPWLLLSKNKKANFVAWYIAATSIFLALARIIEVELHVLEDFGKQNPAILKKSPLDLDHYLFTICLLVLLGSTMYAVATQWQQDAVQNEVSQKQKIASELALLKAQINPHFFFNTLNNIYSLTYSDIPMSREALLKLSRMMRYVLYETISDKSLVSKEMTFVQDYIELMTIRVPALTKVNFVEKTPEKEFLVAPMLLLPFIENAFKYGIDAVNPALIDIELGITANNLHLFVQNDISGQYNNQISQKGIGLLNTRKRLDLLYPGKHTLKIDENRDGKYEVMLHITLEELSA